MKKRKVIKVFLLIACFLLLIFAGLYFLMQRQTYNIVETVEYYENISTDNPGYQKYLNGILKYTRDGVAFLDEEGVEIWNHPCQIKNPEIVMRGEVAAVYDRGGTSVAVFEEEGLKGEIKTTRPIEALSVSSQGIVAAILRNEEFPMVMCYDATGNVLVQQNTSLDHTGFPMDIALSEDGKLLLVSYLVADGTGISSRIVYYDFSDEDISKSDYKIQEQTYPNVVIPLVSYLNKETSMLLSDNSLILYQGTEKPEELSEIALGQICNAAYSEKLIALQVKSAEDSAYRLQIYNVNGELLSESVLAREYSNMKVRDNEVILYEGTICGIYGKSGICRYEGEVNANVLEMYPLFGLNKYMMISADGFYEIRLAK